MGVTFDLCLEVLKFYAKAEDVDPLYVIMCFLNGLLSLTAIVGNVAMIYALQKASSIPPTSRILMQSLAATDLSVGVLGHPLYIAVIAGIRQSYGCENIHEILMAFFILSASLVVVSFQMVIFIGVDRFLAITLHLRYNELVTPKRVVIMVIAVWVVTLSTVFIGVFYYFQAGEIVMVVCGYVSMLLLSIVYMKVYFVARRHQASINSQAQVSSNLNLARNKNLAFKTLYVFVVFELCYLPYLIAFTALLVSGPSVVLQGTVQFTTVLVMLNSSLNPIVFGWKMTEIRQIVKNKFKTLFCCTES
ncbi:histamine H2 receptor-like [Oculina patagonica]